MPAIKSLSEFNRSQNALIEELADTREPLYLTRNGSASVVVMDAEAFDREMAIHERVRDREIRVQKSIMRGYEDYLAGRFVPLDQALDEADRAREAR